jgi:hypothetical protein
MAFAVLAGLYHEDKFVARRGGVVIEVISLHSLSSVFLMIRI